MNPLTEVLSRPENLSLIDKDEIPAILGQMESARAILTARMFAPQNAHAEQEDKETLITVEEMARRTSFTEQYCYGLIQRGEIPSIRTGKYVRIRVADLDKWIESHTEKNILTTDYTMCIVTPMNGQELLKIRKALGRTQEQLAELIGTTANTIARWERDEVTISEPLSRFIRLLAKLEMEVNPKNKHGRE